jgi:hypothetical protein
MRKRAASPLLFVTAFLIVFPGCSTTSSVPFSGTLDDIKNEQRGRLYLRCLHDMSGIASLMPDTRGNLAVQCRNWGQRMVR